MSENEEEIQSWLKKNYPSVQYAEVKVGGVVGLLSQAETLYGQDKELEAWALIDSYLQFPEKPDTRQWLQAALDRLRILSEEKGDVRKKGDWNFEITPKSNLALVAAVVELLGRCTVAVMDRYEVSDKLRRDGLRNALLMTTIGSEEPRFLTLAAQIFAICGANDKAIELLDQALMLDPNNTHARKTLERIMSVAEGEQ